MKLLINKSNRRGTVMVLVVLMMLVLIGFIGLALDGGLIFLVNNRLQAGADAAALAGARLILPPDKMPARLAAQDLALHNPSTTGMIHLRLNEANAADGDIVLGRYWRDTGVFVPRTYATNAIQVQARRTASSVDGPLPLNFSPVFGVNTAQRERSAIAMTYGSNGAGIIVLDEGSVPKAFYVRGSAFLRVNNGDIQVNSTHGDAADLQGSKGVVIANQLNVVGGASPDDYWGTAPGPATLVNESMPVVHDPLAWLVPPAWDPAQDLSSTLVGGDMTLQPGYYSAGFSFSGGTITLRPGIYVLGGAGLDIRGGTNISAQYSTGAPGGVMFYVVQGPININGTGAINLSAPDPARDTFSEAGYYGGTLLFQARDNTSDNLINGTSGLSLSGTIYLPGGHTTLSGTSDKLGIQLLARTLEVAGNSNITINYDGRNYTSNFRVFLIR